MIFMSVLIGLAFVEVITRVVYSIKLDYQIEMSRYAAQLKTESRNKEILHRHIPGKSAKLMGVPVKINSHGFRDNEYSIKKDDGVFRIFLLGDSLTFGWGVSKEDRFSEHLERILSQIQAERGSSTLVQVINSGIGNFNTQQEVALFEVEGKKWQPDLVILNYFINDAEETAVVRSPKLISYSYLAMWLWGRVDILRRLSGGDKNYSDYYRDLYADGRPGWMAVERSLQRLEKMAKADGFQLVVALLPDLHTVWPDYAFKDVHEKVKKLAHNSGIDKVFDVAPSFEGEDPSGLWVSADDAHPNERAQEIIARALAKYLVAEGVF